MPHHIRINDLTQGTVIPVHVNYCDSFYSRLKGFTFRKEISVNEGLILAEKHDSRIDTSIHMLFVWSDLAVFWVNASYNVVDKTLAKSWHPFYAPGKPSKFVIELHPSRLDDIQIGDTVEFENE
jgi:uncharacterized membrane protein (UPF0127 family)